MAIVERDGVGVRRRYGGIRPRNKGTANGDLGSKPDYSACYFRGDEGGDGGVDVGGVRGEERAD